MYSSQNAGIRRFIFFLITMCYFGTVGNHRFGYICFLTYQGVQVTFTDGTAICILIVVVNPS